MTLFPLADPIPLPAPVWLFKALHILTLGLHFIAVEILLGGLLMAVILNFLGASNSLRQGAASAMACRLPIVMTYVINLGVPPLLFAQVLYGPALYTSNVLIGSYWFSIIFLLMACYWLLYRFADGVAEGRQVWVKGLLAWILAGCISKILSTNMALMIRPEDWQGMYTKSALGSVLPPFDPTLLPRWLFMLTGGFAVAGLWMVWIAGRRNIVKPFNAYLSGLGGKLAAAMILVQLGQLFFILKNQPSVVISGIGANMIYKGAEILWIALAALIFIFALWIIFKKPCSYAAGYVAAGLVFLSVLSWTVLRDGIRDLTLVSKGYDVWQQVVVTNWSVVVIFLVTFVLGLAAVVWLISVMMKAKPAMEGGI